MKINKLALAQDFQCYYKPSDMKHQKKTTKKQPEEGKKEPEKSKKTLKERVHEHLNNKNDIITDEDIQNIKVGEDGADEASKAAEKLTEALEEKKITSPWSILSEEDK